MEGKIPMYKIYNAIANSPSCEEDEVAALLEAKRYEDARAYIEKMLAEKTDHNDVEPMIACKGDLLRLTGHPEEAKKHYQTIVDNADARGSARYRSLQGLARILLDEGKASEAIPVLEKAIEKFQFKKGPFEKLLEEAKKMIT